MRHTLGDLQHAIMKVLWERGEATSAEVHAALRAERGLAFTTIATMLRKMEDKGVVAHRPDGRQFIYRPVVSEDQVRRSMVGELVARLFEGGSVMQTIVEMEMGFLMLMSVGDGSNLTVLTTEEADIGQVGYEMALLVDRVGRTVEAQARVGTGG